jgi:hypothetical protein
MLRALFYKHSARLMYQYDAYDQKIVDQRVAQYRDQTQRYLAGELTEDEFRPFAYKTAFMCNVTRLCCVLPFLMACCLALKYAD